MRVVHLGRLDLGLTCKKRWSPPMPKLAMTYSKLKTESTAVA
jgi:hypothetical protein